MNIKKQLTKFSLYSSIALVTACGINYVAKQDFKNFIEKNEKNFDAKVIYDEDNRKDIYDVKSLQLLSLETSTVGLAKKNRVTKKNNGNYKILTSPYGKERHLCKSERFYNQYMTTHCSGALVGKNTVITAGHCITDLKHCQETTFIFGLSHYIKNKGIPYDDYPADNVYQCKDVVYTVAEYNGLDFAVITLDRDVTNRRPLNYRTFGQPKKDDPLVMIGKPSGLPTKVTDSGKIYTINSKTIRTNIDAYGANSGSPVFNAKSGDIEGILIRGALDFIYDKENKCFKSHICNSVEKGTVCSGEEATLMSQVLPYLPLNDKLIKKEENLKIPDSPASGIISNLIVNNKINYSKFIIHLDISHSWTGDLTVSLTSPSGKELVLVESTGNAGSNLNTSIGYAPNIQKKLQALAQGGITGQWKLNISDGFSRDIGTLNKWAIEFK